MYPANTIHSPYAGVMLARRLRRRPNINPAYWFNVSCLLGNLYVSGVTHTKSFLSGLNNQKIPSKHEPFTQDSFNAGPPYTTLKQLWVNVSNAC